MSSATTLYFIAQCNCLQAKRFAAYFQERFAANVEFVEKDDQAVVFRVSPDDCIEDIVRVVYSHPILSRPLRRCFIAQNCQQASEFTVESLDHFMPDPKAVLRVQVHPRDKEDTICAAIPLHIDLHPKNFTHILSIVYVNEHVYFGFSLPSLYFTDVIQHSAQDESALNRARYKIEEAIDRGNLAHLVTKDSIVIDLGAAPGGWSAYLADKVRCVYAIDPVPLQVQRDNIVEMREKSETATEKLKQQHIQCDLLLSDMVLNVYTAISIVSMLRDLVKVGGGVIITLKLARRAESTIEKYLKDIADHFHKEFPGFKLLRIVHLLSNSTNERCLIATKCAET